MKHGYGELVRVDGSQYMGEWQNDLMHGNGVEIDNYTRYEGSFREG